MSWYQVSHLLLFYDRSVLTRPSLAYAELYLTIAAMVQNFDLELVDSSMENIIPNRDFGHAFDKDYNFGVNFRVTKVLQG